MTAGFPPLLPQPRAVHPRTGLFVPPSSFSAEHVSSEIGPGTGGPQSYRLTITPADIHILAADPAGAFYARMTLRQLARLHPGALPCCEIEDGPDIPVRGVMLDVSRDKVPSMATLFMLIDMLAEWKVNHLQLYMEHTFAYSRHREVWAESSPFTADEIRALDAHCRDRFMELAPNQNSFGHFERWLRHDRYRPLAECPDGYTTPAGETRRVPSTLDPTQPKTLALLDELYAELLPCFHSRLLHIGCDETWELGKGRSRAEVERAGLHQIYLGFLGKLKTRAARHGRTALYWGDMVWNHFPERLPELDRDMIHVDWGYYRDYPFQAHGEKLAEAGLPFWLAPGTSAWSTLLGCNEAGLGSNRSAARAALACGAQGLLNTDWGDGGHWQYLPVSFIGFAAGAAMAWCEPTNPDAAIRAALDPHVFHDAAGVMGAVAYDLADTWRRVSENATQANLLDRILRGGFAHVPPPNVTPATLADVEAHIRSTMDRMRGARMARPDAALMLDEFANNARMAVTACKMGRLLLARETGDRPRAALAGEFAAITAEHRRLWLARNRPGGLADSVRVFELRLEECRTP